MDVSSEHSLDYVQIFRYYSYNLAANSRKVNKLFDSFSRKEPERYGIKIHE